MSRFLPLIAICAFILGFWSACSIGFDPTDTDLQFSCTENADCISPNECRAGVCQRAGGEGRCEDKDGDGYGVGEDRETCRLCQEQGDCREDCNDNDEAINPGLTETCDGKDNDCDGEVDEPIECEDSLACPDESGTIPACEGGTCVYKPTNQLGECAGVTLACVGGERETPPAECQ